MNTNIRVHNPNASSVVIDLEGHSLGGHSAVEVKADRRTYALIEAGLLLDRTAVQRATPAEKPAAASKRTRTTTADTGIESGE